MGSSDNGAGVVDCSVGSIVWVRRRNGSWWPGKILGPEELSAAHLMSPRSGTPVKLLGREDASVDWYNLEKSKRVKAFRCGEFDDCIARVESSQGIPPKKREKYARREDAILHALELEKELLEKRYGKSGYSSNGASFKSSDAEEKESVILSECFGYGNGKHVLHKSHAKKLESFIDEKSMDHNLYAQKVKEGTQPGDEDNSEAIPRMRGLQDFGLRIAPSKRKLSSPVASNGSRKPEGDNDGHALPSSIGNSGTAICRSPLDKKRKSHDILTDDSLVRRRDKRRPLIQVLRSSSKLPILQSLQYDNDGASTHMSEEEQMGTIQNMNCSSVRLPGDSSICSDDKQIGSERMPISSSHFKMSNCPRPAALGEENTSRSTENTETDSSETDSLDSEDEEMVEFSDAAVVTELEPKSLGISVEQVHQESMSNEESNGLALPSEMCLHCPPVPVPASIRVSKWKLKGKRNNRGLAKRPIDVTDRRVSRGSMYENIEERENNGHDEPGLVKKNFRAQRFALDNQGYSTSKSIFDWEDLALNEQPVMKGYWEHSSYNYDPVFIGRHSFGGRMKSVLVDVDLKVQSSYQREHVPMICLMSKLNGQAIIGHPIQIEALENGSSEILLSASDSFYSETIDNDPALPPVWRTARRTANFRVRRSHPSATLGGEETSGDLPDADQKTKTIIKKSGMGGFGHKASMMGKNLTHASRPMMDKKYSRKPPKKMSLSSSQKIKTLSSIGAEQRLGNNSRHGNNNYEVDGLIKRESGPTAIACIPVKLVFSRLFEELVGRHQ